MKKVFRSSYYVVVASLLLMGFWGCGGKSDTPAQPSSKTKNPPHIDQVMAVASTTVNVAEKIIFIPSVSDPDGDALTCWWSTQPSNKGSFNAQNTCTVTWTAPDTQWVGEICLSVSDGVLHDGQCTSVIVCPTSQPATCGERDGQFSCWCGASSSQDVNVPVQTTTKSVPVSSNSLWIDTGVTLASGETVCLTASGSWKPDPNQPAVNASGSSSPCNATGCPIASANSGALVGKIGSGSPFVIGNTFKFTNTQSGKLSVMINDDTNHLGDNEGFVTLSVQVGC